MIGAFPWQAARERLMQCAGLGPLHAESGRFVGEGFVFVPPAVLPPILDGDSPTAWTSRLSDSPGHQIVLLMRAGSASLGVWHDDACLHHKAFKRYVLRGHGKAQTLHLKTRGKSRYGSRLRLQNAAKLLDEVADRLGSWFADTHDIDVIHWSCPVRQWPELFDAEPAPPFGPDDPRLRRIAMHVHEPDHEELLRVRRRLGFGRIEAREV